MNDHLGVGVRGEHVPALEQLAGQLAIVVDLAVEDDLHGAVFVADRLVAGLQVDDAEAIHPEAERAVGQQARLVGAAVLDGVAHGAQRGLVHAARAVPEVDAVDPAHRQASRAAGLAAAAARAARVDTATASPAG